MKHKNTCLGLFIAFAISLLSVPPSSVAKEVAREKITAKYASPSAVCDAFLNARKKQDWKTFFSCFTPNFQREMVFECYFTCQMKPNKPEILEVLKKHHVDDKSFAIENEYYKRYKAKHGVDIAKMIAERKQDLRQTDKSKKVPPLPPQDNELVREVVVDQIKDKEGFFEAVSKIFASKDESRYVGTLKDLTFQGDKKAKGKVGLVIYHWEKKSKGPSRKVGDVVDKTFRFSKSKDGWLIERIGGKPQGSDAEQL